MALSMEPETSTLVMLLNAQQVPLRGAWFSASGSGCPWEGRALTLTAHASSFPPWAGAEAGHQVSSFSCLDPSPGRAVRFTVHCLCDTSRGPQRAFQSEEVEPGDAGLACKPQRAVVQVPGGGRPAGRVESWNWNRHALQNVHIWPAFQVYCLKGTGLDTWKLKTHGKFWKSQ